MISKSMGLFLIVFLAGSAARAETTKMSCFGTSDNKGAHAELVIRGAHLALQGDRLNGTDRLATDCAASFDFGYEPRTPHPKLDRYSVEFEKDACPYYQAFVTREIQSAGQGYVTFSIECGHPGDFCEISYFCKAE